MIKVEELTERSFEEFGTFFNPGDCGPALGDQLGPIKFYPDRIVQQFVPSNYIAISSLVIEPRPFEITLAEIHENTEEVFGGFAQDVYFFVGAPDRKEPSARDLRAFRLPTGWWVRLKRHVWHHAPFVAGREPAVGIVILPPWTYSNDCIVVQLDEPVTLSLGDYRRPTI
ncbi:MAG: hypothetical protein HPY71_00510 [Firmicutes bacterium]|nr:hypothetical protein [Bacillota bacterium]